MPEMFDPVRYWNELSGSKMALSDVGWPNWTEAYNAYRYRLSMEQISETLDAYKVTDPGEILEIGCGVGFWSRFLAQKYPRANYLGLDISQQAIRKLGERHASEPRLKFLHADASEVKAGVNQFDLAICLEVLLHIVDPARWEKTLVHIAASLKPGGLALISDPISVYSPPPAFKLGEGGVNIHAMSEWETVLKANGLEIIEIKPRTFFLDNNFDFASPTALRLWKKFFGHYGRILSIKNERLGAVLGYMAYRFDKIYASNVKLGHSCKMLVLRKR